MYIGQRGEREEVDPLKEKIEPEREGRRRKPLEVRTTREERNKGPRQKHSND